MINKRFLGLDGLRGVCALTVLVYHCFGFFRKGTVVQHGFLAVDMFFILSGFVIALTYEERLKSGQRPRDFLFNRARRLFPTYWLAAYLTVALFIGMTVSGALATGDKWWMIWLFIPLTTLAMIPDYITPDGMLYPAMDGVAWSLFVEWIAYISYALGAFRKTIWFFIATALGGWGLMAALGIHSGAGWCGGGDRSTLLTIGILRCLPAFAAGVVIYRVHKHPAFQRLPVISTEFLLALWVCIALLPRPVATPILDAVIVVILSPLLVCLLIRSDHRAPGYCRRLGELSYPLYVIHPGLIMLADFTPVFGLLHGPRPLNGLLLIALSIALAWAAMKAIARLPRARAVRDPEWQAYKRPNSNLMLHS